MLVSNEPAPRTLFPEPYDFLVVLIATADGTQIALYWTGSGPAAQTKEKRGMTMHYCPYLSGKYFKACSVGRETYVPSAFELGEYCASGRHTMCPFYSKREYGLPYDKRPALASGTR